MRNTFLTTSYNERPMYWVQLYFTNHSAVVNELLLYDERRCPDDDVTIRVDDHRRVVRPVAPLHCEESL